jgi:hypothetical protein
MLKYDLLALPTSVLQIRTQEFKNSRSQGFKKNQHLASNFAPRHS